MTGITEMARTPPPQSHGRDTAPPGLARRLGWFVLLWAGGVATVGAVAILLRAWIGA